MGRIGEACYSLSIDRLGIKSVGSYSCTSAIVVGQSNSLISHPCTWMIEANLRAS